MPKTIREVYGDSLLKYGLSDKRVVVLDSDVSASTRTDIFAAKCPERFFNLGIAESNMVGFAAGLATCGKIPFANTFAVFMSTLGLLGARAFGSYSGLNIKLMGAYCGLSDAFDGASHHSLEDLAVMRSLPGFAVYTATDAILTDWLVKNAIEQYGPMYVRLSRDALPDIYSEGEQFETGKGKILREGNDAAIIACGVMVSKALEAADILAERGISARVVDMFCVKPIDRELIMDCAKNAKVIVTAEEHSVIGGLGGAVAEVLAEAGASTPLCRVGVNDVHAESGLYPLLLEKYGLSAGHIVKKVTEALGK